eukprot:Phypoly_transcript_22307.p1 GENE.Phypoly_transcript_22307~~Phypoly_transcript_22307.p1  ORF type:complete len:144 (+),score=22.77 Phypoly_transcript_22307:120-551(+)
MKYMVCVDGSEFGDAAFERAKELYVAQRDSLVVVLVHSDDLSKRQAEKEVIQKYAKQCVRQYNSKMVAEPIATGSSVGATILQTAKDEGVDAIIIGRRGMSKMQRVFAGSVSRYVMENAECDVFVVKADSTPKPKTDGAAQPV